MHLGWQKNICDLVPSGWRCPWFYIGAAKHTQTHTYSHRGTEVHTHWNTGNALPCSRWPGLHPCRGLCSTILPLTLKKTQPWDMKRQWILFLLTHTLQMYILQPKYDGQKDGSVFLFMLIFRLILLFWMCAIVFTCFNVQKTSVYFRACLFKAPFQESPVCSDWSALTSLSMHHPLCFRISIICVFATMAVLGTWLREGTVQLWHHNFTEVLTTYLKQRLCALLFWRFHGNDIASMPALRLRKISLSTLLDL